MSAEILAPCGGADSVKVAVAAGADAIYIGGERFSARAAAKNFDHEEMAEAVRFCHLYGVKVYRAMNTVIFDSEAEAFADEVRFSSEIGVDALIVQDIGGLMIAKAVSGIPLHASTQMTVICPAGAELAVSLGCCRVVPARELELSQIKSICATAETEVFVHGAQCMCLSGQCYMSAMIGGRSANRGCCAQSCRLPFAKGKRFREGEYALSLKDLSFVKDTDRLEKAGVASFKIEGRMKSPEYTAAAVSALAAARQGRYTEDMERYLAAVFSRQGFTNAYLYGKTGKNMFGYRTYEDVNARKASPDEIFPKNDRYIDTVDFEIEIRQDRPIMLKAALRNSGISCEVSGTVPDKAMNRPTNSADAEKALSKLGGTDFAYGAVKAEIDDGLYIPQSELNMLRRKAVDALSEQVIVKNTPNYTLCEGLPVVTEGLAPKKTEYRYYAENIEQAEQAADFDSIVIPIECVLKCRVDREKLIAALPPLFESEDELIKQVVSVYEKGITRFWTENFSLLGLLIRARESCPEIKIHCGQGLNVTNSYTAQVLYELGVNDILLSMEMKLGQIKNIKSPVPTGLLVYGKPVLMTVRNYPGADILTDRTGRQFEVIDHGYYSQIINCDTIDIISKVQNMALSYLLVRGSEPKELLKQLRNGESKSGKGYTNGLYQRGII